MAEHPRIALIGQAAFGESVLSALIDHGETVIAVWCPPDREGAPPDPLKAAAERHGLPVYQFKRLRDAEAVETFASLNADLGVMAFVTDIVPAEMINAPALGTINFHPSLLPKHRGPSSINWPIIQGETETGLTIFWPDAGLDTGPILLQKRVPIGPDDTLGTLYFDTIFPLGVEAMVEAVELIKSGTAPRIEQDESRATYESWCKAEHVGIDWSKPIGEIHNLIRGSDPSPGAHTTLRGETVKLFKTSKEEGGGDGSAPGTVVSITDEGIQVAARGGVLTVGRVQPRGGKKVMASEWIAQVNLQPGDQLGT